MNVLVAMFLAGAAAGQPAADAMLVLDLRPMGVAVEDTRVVDGLVAAAVASTTSRLPAADRPLVHTADELRTLSDVEAQRSMAGCDDGSSSCLAELAGALGARYVVSGTLGRLEGDVVLQLSLLDTKTTSTLARGNATRASVSALAAAVPGVVDELLRSLVPADETHAVAAAGPSPALIGGGVLAAGGVVAAAVGFGGLFVLDTRLAPGSGATTADKEQAIQLAWPALIVGSVGAVAGVVGAVVAGVGFTSTEP
jgi:hypothetical protein